MEEAEAFDVVVIGGGSGLTAAWFAEQDGKKVALIDKRPDALGGTCVNFGCIPSKGLIQAADVMQTFRNAWKFGIEVDMDDVEVDFRRVKEVVLERRHEGSTGTKGWVDSAFTPFYGHARFVDKKTVQMEDGTRITAERFFIATGARPMVPPIPGLDEVEYWTNVEAIDALEQPESLLVLGGGYIGCELAHFYSAVGTKCTMVEMGEVLGPEDHDIRSVFRDHFKDRVTLFEGYKADRAFQDGDGVGLEVVDKDGNSHTLRGEKLLVAAGRAPDTDDLGLKEAGVETYGPGFIEVDDHLRTANERIYAYGDVIGKGMFKHTSSKEGEIAYQNSQGADRIMDYRTNPHAVFSEPPIGSVGLTEQECKDQGLKFRKAKADYDSVMKGKIVGSPPGLCKLLVEEGSDRILGFHFAGPGAPDMVHEIVLAMNVGDGTAQAVRDTIHIHPTMPELVKSVFDQTA